jgi:hypothetical protein
MTLFIPDSGVKRRPDGEAEEEEPSIGHSLMGDIQRFLQQRGAVVREDGNLDSDGADGGGSTERDDDDEEEEDTLQDVPDVDAGVKRRGVGGGEARVRFRDDELEALETDLSPPRIPRSSPSYLIWSIFTKEREERERRARSSNRGRGSKACDNLLVLAVLVWRLRIDNRSYGKSQM